MSSLDRIRQAFPELANASDSEVLSEVSRRTGAPTSQLADTLGIKPSGTLYETGRQIVGGLVVDAPEMLGQAMKYYSQPGGQRANEGPFQRLGRPSGLERQYGVEITEPDLAYTAGQSLVESARERAPEWAPDMRGRGLVGQALVLGGRGVGAMAPTLAAMALPGGQVAAPALQAALFGGSSAQDTYEKLIEQGVPEAEAAAAARRVWAVQGVGEGIATAGLGAAFRPAMAAVRGAPTAAGVARAATDTGVIRPLARGMALNVPLQAGTEVAQDVGTELIERQYGARPEDIGEIARQSALGGAGMSLLLGPLAAGGQVARSRRAAALKEALYGSSTPIEVRAQAMDLVAAEARRQGVAEQDIGAWMDEQFAAEDARTEALRTAEAERRNAAVNLLGEKAQQLEGLQTPAFASLDQQRAFEQGMSGVQMATPFSSLDQQRAFEQGLQAASLANIERTGQQYQDLMGGRASTLMQAQDLGQQAQEVMAPQQRGLEAAQRAGEQWQEVRAGKTRLQMEIEDIGREWQKRAAEIPQPVTGELTRGQRAALRGPEGRRLRPTSTPITPVEGGPMATTLLQPPQAAPSSPLPTPAASPSSLLTERPAEAAPIVSPPSGAPAVSTPAAPVAAGGSLEQPMAPQEQRELQRLIDAADSTDTGRALPAAVRGAETVKAPGKATITDQVLRKIRDALVYGREATGVDEGTKRVVGALNRFTESYEAYLRAGDKVTQKRKLVKKDAVAETDAAIEALNMHAQNTRQALAELGEAVGGNAKNVEAVVRLVKDMVQGKIVTPGRTKADTIRAAAKLDTVLSQAWAAAKREVFLPENVDLADVRGSAVRQSREVDATGEMSQIERAATEGIYVNKETGTLKGIAAIMHYLRRYGTPMERQLAVALREAFVAQENPVQVQFIEGGTPRFDPTTNTIYIRRNESPEVLLHEAFHGALQSFVYRNPQDAAVIYLKRALKDVVNFKGELTGKAKEVQDLLKKLVAEKKELDAVLELVSYGTTLNDFRRAMQAMPSRGVPASFTTSVNKLWAAIKRAASRMLGDKPSLASDVLQASMDLLDQARKKAPQAGMGNVLEAAVQSEQQSLQAAGYPDLSAWKAPASNSLNVTRLLFERLGFGKNGTVDKAVQDRARKATDYIRKELPGLEKVVRNIYTNFGLGASFQRIRDFYRQQSQAGILETEFIVEYLHRNPMDAQAVLDYLDGDTTAMDGLEKGPALKAIADTIKQQLDQYIARLPAADQAFFADRKLTDFLLAPKEFSQLAGKSFGLRALSRLIKPETRVEENIEDFKQYLPFENGVLNSDAPLYQVFETFDAGDGKRIRAPFGFISKELAETNPPAGLDIDRDRIWNVTKSTKENAKAFTFATRRTSGADLRALAGSLKDASLSEEQRNLALRQLTAALLNTVSAMSQNYAARNLVDSLATLGYRGDTPTASSVVFDDIATINKLFPGRNLKADELLDAGADESKIAGIKGAAQRTGVWVKIPKTATYGKLGGKIVSGPAWSSIMDMHDRKPLLGSEALNTVMSSFKKAKTVYSPATHANNILTNYSMLLLHGISHKALGDAAKLFYKFNVNPKSLSDKDLAIVQAFFRSGAVLGQYTNTEAKAFIAESLSKHITPDSDRSMLSKLLSLSKFEKNFADALERAARTGKNIDARASELYAAGDNVFRLAAFMQVAGNMQAREGTPTLTAEQEAEAGLAARKMFLDYDIDSRWVKAARQSIFPFVSWSYAIMPVLGRLAIDKPWAIVNMMSAVALMAALTDGDDDEWRENGPEQVRDTTLGVPKYIRIPFLGTDEAPVYWNIGKSIPMLSLFEPAPGEAKLAGQSWIPGFATPGGPFVSLIASGVYGIDPFTGKKLSDLTEEDHDRLFNTGKAVWDTMAPSLLTSRLWGQAKDVLQQKQGPTGVDPDALFIARTFGLSLYEFDRSEVEFRQDSEVKRLEREFTMVMNKAKREEMAKGYPDYEALDERLEDLREKLEKRINEVRGIKE